MDKTNKFQIYYAPKNKKNDISFTISFSHIDENDNIYKLKVIKERKSKTSINVNTYKIKELHFNTTELLQKINKIDFSKKYDKEDISKDIYYIKYNNQEIITSNKSQIQEILDIFRFDELYNIPITQYNQIKNVYEFLDFNKLFRDKSKNLNNDKFMSIYDYYLNKNPYKVFENLNNLEQFCG